MRLEPRVDCVGQRQRSILQQQPPWLNNALRVDGRLWVLKSVISENQNARQAPTSAHVVPQNEGFEVRGGVKRERVSQGETYSTLYTVNRVKSNFSSPVPAEFRATFLVTDTPRFILHKTRVLQ